MESDNEVRQSESDEDHNDGDNVEDDGDLSTNDIVKRIGDRMFFYEIIKDKLSCQKCGIVMDPNDHDGLINHIASEHRNDLIEEEVERDPPSKKPRFNKPFEDKATNLDLAICKFFSKFGLSSDVVRDMSFMQLICSVGKSRSLPNPTAIDIFVKKTSISSKFDAHAYHISKPFTCTMDILKQKNENFLAYSIHYFTKDNIRRNLVFLQKLAVLEVNASAIVADVRKNIFAVGKKPNFTNFVSTSSVYEKAFHKTGYVDNSYVCYFSYVSNYAEGLIRHELFHKGIETLKEFVLHVRSSHLIYGKLQRHITIQKAYFDLPETDYSKWTGLSDFLSQLLHLHPFLVEFADNNNIAYIDDQTQANLSHLQMLLGFMQISVKKCSTPDSCVSQVLPEVIEMEKFIDGAFSPEVKQCFKEVFDEFMQPMINHYRGGVYEFATLLDPRFAYEAEVLSTEEWTRIRTSLKESLIKTNIGTRSERATESLIEKELKKYEKAIAGLRLGSNVHTFDWWAQQATVLPLMFEKAKTVLCPPACAIDAEYFFGKRGKLMHMNGKMQFKKFNEWLVLAGSQEKFRGRGCPENEPLQLEPICIGIVAGRPKPPPPPVVPKLKRIRALTQKEIEELARNKVPKTEETYEEEQKVPMDGVLHKKVNGMHTRTQTKIATAITPIDEEKKVVPVEEFHNNKASDPQTSQAKEIVVKDEPLDEDEYESMLMQPPSPKRLKSSSPFGNDEHPIVKSEDACVEVKNEIIDDEDDVQGTSEQSRNVTFESNSNVNSTSTISTSHLPRLPPGTSMVRKIPLQALHLAPRARKIANERAAAATGAGVSSSSSQGVTLNGQSTSSHPANHVKYLSDNTPVTSAPIITGPVPHFMRVQVHQGEPANIRNPSLVGNVPPCERPGSYRIFPVRQTTPTIVVGQRVLRRPPHELAAMQRRFQNPGFPVRVMRVPPIPSNLLPTPESIRKNGGTTNQSQTNSRK